MISLRHCALAPQPHLVCVDQSGCAAAMAPNEPSGEPVTLLKMAFALAVSAMRVPNRRGT